MGGEWQRASDEPADAATKGARLVEAGFSCHKDGRLADAERLYTEAILVDENNSLALYLRGTLLSQAGRFDAGIRDLLAALRVNPLNPAALNNLGNALRSQGRLDEAIARYGEAVHLNPDYAEALCNLAVALTEQGKHDEAAAHYTEVLRIDPDNGTALANLGYVLMRLGRLDEAIARYTEALRIDPDNGTVLTSLGGALIQLERVDEAIARYTEALRIGSDPAGGHYNLGNALKARGRLDEALAHYTEALRIDPGRADIHGTDGLARLLVGDFKSGWEKYEWRWRVEREEKPRGYPQPLWNGAPLASGRLLAWGEQGVGDEIQFAGLIPDLIRRGVDVVLGCEPRLQPLFARSFPLVSVVGHSPAAKSEAPPFPDIAAHIPTGSLPRYLRRSEADFRATTSPYLIAAPESRAYFRGRYRRDGLAVGIAWYSGSPVNGKQRSLTLVRLAPLFATPNVHWVCLQYGAADLLAAEAAQAAIDLIIDPEVDQLVDLDRFAAQVSALDLVITIDNATAHMAGALGVPTWVMVPYVPDWRWRLNREDSPWYPTVRLFRQPALGDWDTVVRDVAQVLRTATAQS